MSFRELLAELGKDGAVAERLNVDRELVKSMRRRDSVAPEYWSALETAAADAGICVDASDFARWRANKARVRREERSAA